MRLAAPDVERDALFDIPALRPFLNALGSHDPGRDRLAFRPQSQLLAFEDWVARHLDAWLGRHLDHPQTCPRLHQLMRAYHDIARALYQGSAEANSAMLLTILDLWVACDKSAVAIHPLLERYHHDIPTRPFQSLLLSFKTDMDRLCRAERHLERHDLECLRREYYSHLQNYEAGYCQHDDISVRVSDGGPLSPGIVIGART